MRKYIECHLKDLPVVYEGKVRTLYDIGDDKHYLMVTSDRISAFDSIIPSTIPGKGVLLNQMSNYWFEKTSHIINNHCVIDDYPHVSVWEPEQYPDLIDRSMIIRKTDFIPLEAIVRGYIAGSAWTSYQNTGSVCGLKLPKGMIECERLSEPLFTPSTKAQYGSKDLNITFSKACDIIGKDLAQKIRLKSLQLFDYVSSQMAKLGIILADTKFEFGLLHGELVLIDELFTCDSSRFWPTATYSPGSKPYCLDKDVVRNHLEQSVSSNHHTVHQSLSHDIICQTIQRYHQAAGTLSIDTFQKGFTLGIC